MAQKLTGKDLIQLSELLESESLAYQKCCSYAACASDPTLRGTLQKFAANHRARFDKLYAALNSAQ